MTTEISGTVKDETGSSIDGATVYVVRASDDSIAGVTTTNVSGEFQFTGLSDTETYHVGAQWDDGSTKYAGESFPFVEPYTDTGPIDDFEDADLAEYSGDIVSFQVQNNIVYERTEALEMTNDDDSRHEIYSLDGDGLPRYPSSGDTFSFRIYFENADSSGEFWFGVQDTDNLYRAMVQPNISGIEIRKADGGFVSTISNTSAAIPIGEWLEGVIEWKSNGDITFTLNDASGAEVASASGNDGTYSSGGIGWDGFADEFSGYSIYYDIAELTNTTAPGATGAAIDDYEDGDIAEYSGETG
jgi:hypothetical protein